ncbi:bifunctional diguanylate cyclase/phosphodiesterase [Undibacterium sp. Ren11W]|uniref:bifunctional diguanylate cyclase/phosphodiesterase n=1 Tax=Undibacterium sp. Ren11W TaxID=3413045 RepID=UPI003BF2D914
MNQIKATPFFNMKAVPAAALTAAVFLSITAWLCWLSLQVSKEDLQRQQQQTILEHHATIQNELDHEVSQLDSFVSLYHISPNFNRYAFHSFAKIENKPWLIAKLFSRRVKFDDMREFESMVKTDTTVDVRGYPDFVIQDKQEHQDALVALYLEPRQLLQKIQGLNLEKWFPVGSKRMKESAQTLSFLIKDSHPILRGNNIILSTPVYETHLPIRNEIQRKIAFEGTFSTVISIDKLINGLLDSPSLSISRVELIGSGVKDEALIIPLKFLVVKKQNPRLFLESSQLELPLSVPGKKWAIRYEMQMVNGVSDNRVIWLIALIGLLLTMFASGFVYVTIHTGKIALSIAKEMTKALHISEDSLLETQRLAKMGSFQIGPLGEISELSGNIRALFEMPTTTTNFDITQILEHIDEQYRLAFNSLITRACDASLHTHLIIKVRKNTPTWLNLIVDSSITEASFTLRVIAMDVTEKYQAEQKIKHLAYQDSLTGLANRASLRIATEQAILTSIKDGNQLALIFLDLDRFKFINDSAGHDIGDQVLTEIGKRLRSAVKSRDFIARLGGDEFVILVEELTSEVDLKLIAERILALVSAPMVIGLHTYYLTTSIGIALAENGKQNADILMKQADIAMYHSKEKGKNKYTMFSSAIAEALENKTKLEIELRSAIENSLFIPYYQPQYRVDTGLLCGVESLLRWNHPRRGMLSAKEFIDTAEESGLIIQIGNQVLTDVCNTISTWDMPEDFIVGVNVSSLQFFQVGFVDFVIKTIRRAGIPPQRLEIEVTETMIMHDTEVARTSLEQLHAFGVGVSIDDFGTGYASLTYLRDFPVQRIKIDQRFVQGHTENHKDMAIVKAISTLGHDFGMQVIAEGVETEAQLVSLGRMGCDLYQGWLRSNALPATSINQLLNDAMLAHETLALPTLG